jgi:hypothetical protein
MRNQQFIAVKSITTKKGLDKLKQQLVVANKCLIEKDRIIEGLRLDLAHLVDQLPRIKQHQNNDRSIN